MHFSATLPFALLTLLAPSASNAATQPNQFGLIGPQNMMLLLNGFHFISGHTEQYLQANHHCVVMADDFIQCAIYVPGSNPARLAGIEYIITGDAFAKLPMEERQLWHSHKYEVESGLLTEPGMPTGIDDEVMKILVDSYGKTVHTWRFDQKNNTLPLGIPELVNGYTQDGQLTQDFIDERDEYFGLNSTEIRQRRKEHNVSVPAVQEGADIWKKGIVLTLELKNTTKGTHFAGLEGEGLTVQEREAEE